MDVAKVGTLPEHRAIGQVRRARNLRRIGLGFIWVVVGLGLTGLLGVKTGEVRETDDGYTLRVRYPQVTRAGIAVPFHVRVEHPGGFSQPVQLAFTEKLFERFDFANFYPNPSAETASGGFVYYEFDPPPGDVLEVSLDARTAPDQNGSFSRYRAVLLVADAPVTQVSFRLTVVP